jgi:alpha-tubulin suppressor-like RCC1 family protein
MSCNNTNISTKMTHALSLLNNGNVTGWGENTYGEINTPSGIQGNVVKVEAGENFSLALLKNNTVSGWGRNHYNQATGIPTGIQGEIVDIAAGTRHGLALLKNGYITGWGRWNVEEENYSPFPTGIQGNFTGIGAGYDYSIALLKDNYLTGWGYTLNNTINTSIPSTRDISGKISSFSVGYQNVIVVLKDSTATGWGRNIFGEANVPQNIQGNISQVSVGTNHSLARLKDSRVLAWGRNTEEQLNIPFTVQGTTTKVYAGNNYSLALSNTNTIKNWGISALNVPNIINCTNDFFSTGYANIYIFLEGVVVNRQPPTIVTTVIPNCYNGPCLQYTEVVGLICPRVSVFESRTSSVKNIFEPGFYKISCFLSNANQPCGIDIFSWDYQGGVGVKEKQNLELFSCPNLPFVSGRAGEFQDQIKVQYNITFPGNYYFKVKIT